MAIAVLIPNGSSPEPGAMSMTTLEILIEARRLLAKGWCQNTCIVVMGGEVVARDIVTALNDAAGGRGMAIQGSPEQRRAYQIVYDMVATEKGGIMVFNDDIHTTLVMVLWVLTSCIYVEASSTQAGDHWQKEWAGPR
jgi:hypothetical protein